MRTNSLGHGWELPTTFSFKSPLSDCGLMCKILLRGQVSFAGSMISSRSTHLCSRMVELRRSEGSIRAFFSHRPWLHSVAVLCDDRLDAGRFASQGIIVYPLCPKARLANGMPLLLCSMLATGGGNDHCFGEAKGQRPIPARNRPIVNAPIDWRN
jgi:hypothetical protein